MLRQRVEELEQLRDRHATDMAVMFQENAALKRELEAFDLVRVASRRVASHRCVLAAACLVADVSAHGRRCVCAVVFSVPQEFFEEIEDLKFKYAQAAQRCRDFDAHLATCGR